MLMVEPGFSQGFRASMARTKMAALASLSKRLLLSASPPFPRLLLPSSRLCTTTPHPAAAETDTDDPPPNAPQQPRPIFDRPLENGLDQGVYKAIMVGKVGQRPVQKHLKSGREIVMFSLGTGGIRNNRRPLDDEDPREYAERCAVQWHRVCIYSGRLAEIALKHIMPGSVLYLEGNIETKVFSDPLTGLVRRLREIALRRDGRLVFLSQESDPGLLEQAEVRGVGYY